MYYGNSDNAAIPRNSDTVTTTVPISANCDNVAIVSNSNTDCLEMKTSLF